VNLFRIFHGSEFDFQRVGLFIHWFDFTPIKRQERKVFLFQRSNCEIARQPSISEAQATITKNTISGNAILSTFIFGQNKKRYKQESSQRYIVI